MNCEECTCTPTELCKKHEVSYQPSEALAAARRKPCPNCEPDEYCLVDGISGCLSAVHTTRLWDFRESYPQGELVFATPRQKVIWNYWRAGYERSFHGEPAVVELGEIQ